MTDFNKERELLINNTELTDEEYLAEGIKLLVKYNKIQPVTVEELSEEHPAFETITYYIF